LTVIKNYGRLIVGTSCGVIRDFDSRRLRAGRVWGESVLGWGSGVHSLCVMGGGGALVVGFKSGKVRVYNIRRRKLVKTLEVKHRGGQVIALETFDLE
jgi:hypothetical protein